MKNILITEIAALLLEGCTKSEEQGFAQQPLVVSGGTGNIVQANPEKVRKMIHFSALPTLHSL